MGVAQSPPFLFLCKTKYFWIWGKYHKISCTTPILTLSTWIWYAIKSHKRDDSFGRMFTLIKCFKIPGNLTSALCLLWNWCHTVGINLLLKGASGNIDSSKNQYLYKTLWHPQMGIDYWMACISPEDLSHFQLTLSEKCTAYRVK